MTSGSRLTTKRKWWIGVDGTVHGPYGSAYIVAVLLTKRIPREALACVAGTEEWRPLTQWSDFSAYIDELPPSLPHSICPNIQDVGLALRHLRRAILGCVIMYLLSIIAMSAESKAEMTPPPPAIDLLNTLVGLSVFVLFPYVYYSIWKLVKASDMSLWWLLAVFPWLGLFGLFFLSHKASTALKQAGVEVGLMGPKLADRPGRPSQR